MDFRHSDNPIPFSKLIRIGENMEVIVKRIETVKLTLTMEEALWLKGIVQNPIGTDLHDEDPKDLAMRQAFWEGLTIAGIKVGS
jgi:hypothetical protein